MEEEVKEKREEAYSSFSLDFYEMTSGLVLWYQITII